MKFEFKPMTKENAKVIQTWRYSGFIKKIYVAPYFSGVDENKGPADCEGFAVFFQEKLVGLFEYYFKKGVLEIGLALSPSLSGTGRGTAFVQQGIKFGIKHFNYGGQFIKLSVNVQNKPALRVYQKVGFREYSRKNNTIEMHLMVN